MAVRSALLYRKKFSFETTQKAKITEKRETNNYGYTSIFIYRFYGQWKDVLDHSDPSGE